MGRSKGETFVDREANQLNLYSLVQQQKALLALAQEQIQVVELEQRLVQAEASRSGFHPSIPD